ncbi:11693_t:CDS:2 [Entrophospora sp. SA101]|nr:11693_t:CDS:2 [Entrophospora sp. SA101]
MAANDYYKITDDDNSDEKVIDELVTTKGGEYIKAISDNKLIVLNRKDWEGKEKAVIKESKITNNHLKHFNNIGSIFKMIIKEINEVHEKLTKEDYEEYEDEDKNNEKKKEKRVELVQDSIKWLLNYRFDEKLLIISKNVPSFIKYGKLILQYSIIHDKEVIIEAIIETCLSIFKSNYKSNLGLLSLITLKLSILEANYPLIVDKFYNQISIILDPSFNNNVPYSKSNLINGYNKDFVIYENSSLWNLYYKLYFNYYKRIVEHIENHNENILNNHIDNIRNYDNNNHNSTQLTLSSFSREKLRYSSLALVIPLPRFTSHSSENCSPFKEIFYKPESNSFNHLNVSHTRLFKYLNGEIILNYKWKRFGFQYYVGIWIFYIFFLLSFSGTTMHLLSKDEVITNGKEQQLHQGQDNDYKYLIITIVLGLIHLMFEVKQLIWNRKAYLRDFWKYFNLVTYILTVFTSSYWVFNNAVPPIWLISFSNLLLDIKFMLFLRAFRYFGAYFAIIIGVAKKPPTLSEIVDDNDPWNLVNKFLLIVQNDTFQGNTNYAYIQQPDKNTNLFTGDSSAFSQWQFADQYYLSFLMVAFSFLVVVYLMNLFIGLLSNAIEENNTKEAFLIERAKVIIEIELFYLLPQQRRWRNWFPDLIYYDVYVDEVIKIIKSIDNDYKEDPENLPFISDKLREVVSVLPKKKEKTDFKKFQSELTQKLQNQLNQNNKLIISQLQTFIKSELGNFKNSLEEK